jgi:biopolymer transport protein ExbB
MSGAGALGLRDRGVLYPDNKKEQSVGDTLTTVRSLLDSGIIKILIQGGPVMIPLMIASVISLGIILERFHFWRRLRHEEVDTDILDLVAEGDIVQALKIAYRSRHPVSQVLHAGLENRHYAPGMAMEAEAQTALQHAKSYLSVLDTIITLAPLLGLLGTITGMISAFGIVSTAGLGQPNAITGGIAEALIATATGLFIAITTLLPYNYFRTKVERLTERIEEKATRMEILLQQKEH